MKKYTIKKGRHYSNHLPRLTYDRRIIEAKVKFSSECWFPLREPDDYAVNKLLGWSFGYHHKDSLRIGWRPSGGEGYIDLFFYIYRYGQRYERYFTTVACDTEYDLTLAIGSRGSISASVGTSVVIMGGHYFLENDMPKLGYILFPYFGGKKTAPHNMSIELELK